jgi:hypothetical protein
MVREGGTLTANDAARRPGEPGVGWSDADADAPAVTGAGCPNVGETAGHPTCRHAFPSSFRTST